MSYERLSRFWKYQPVHQVENFLHNSQVNYINGQIKLFGKQLLQTELPDNLKWIDIDVNNEFILEVLYLFLKDHYVEDVNGMYRLEYSKELIKSMLNYPGSSTDLNVGMIYVCPESSKITLIGFISAIIHKIKIIDKIYDVSEINLLCIHKDLRNKLLAPIMISEITRRVAFKDTQIALYTISKTITKPLTVCNYYSYYLNNQKLKECLFIDDNIKPSVTENLIINNKYKLKYNELYNEMFYNDIELHYNIKNTSRFQYFSDLNDNTTRNIWILFNKFLKKYKINKVFTLKDCLYYLNNKNNITNIIKSHDNKIIGIYTIVNINSSILFKNEKDHDKIKSCYLTYYAYDENLININDLLKDVCILAKKCDFDMLLCLDIMESTDDVLNTVGFQKTNTTLNYYLYNYIIQNELKSNDIGVVFF